MFVEFIFKKLGAVGVAPAKQSQNLMLALIFSLGGNLFFASLFLRALLNPIAHINFIVQTGTWIFLVELLSTFVSGGVMASSRLRFTDFTGIIGFFAISVFAISFGLVFLNNLYLPLIFLGSALVKIVGWQATAGKSPRIYPLLIVSVLAVFIIGPGFWANLFPFTEEFNQHMPADWVARHELGEISGEFVDRPQTMLVWGIIYFTLAAVMELAFFVKDTKIAPKIN